MAYNKQWGNQLISDMQRDFGLSLEAAKGFVGVLAMESEGFSDWTEDKPTVKGSRGGGGMAQWTGPRRKAFESWAKKNGFTGEDKYSYDSQYGYLKYELKGGGKHDGGIIKRLKGVSDATTAGRLTTKFFLRPGKVNTAVRDDWVRIAGEHYTPVPPGSIPTAVASQLDVVQSPQPATPNAVTQAKRHGVLGSVLDVLDRNLHVPTAAETGPLGSSVFHTREKSADLILAEESMRRVPMAQRIFSGGGLATKDGFDLTPDISSLMSAPTRQPSPTKKFPAASSSVAIDSQMQMPKPRKMEWRHGIGNVFVDTGEPVEPKLTAQAGASVRRRWVDSSGTASKPPVVKPGPVGGGDSLVERVQSPGKAQAARVRSNTASGFDSLAEMLTPSSGVAYPQSASKPNGHMSVAADLALLLGTGTATLPSKQTNQVPPPAPSAKPRLADSQLKIQPDAIAPRPRPRLMGLVARELAQKTEAEKAWDAMTGTGAPTTAAGQQTSVATQLDVKKPSSSGGGSGGGSSGKKSSSGLKPGDRVFNLDTSMWEMK